MGIRVHPKESLAAEFKEVAAEWHPTKNGDLHADQVLPGSGKKVWWRCAKGHDWPAYVFSRTKQQSGCPDCFDERRPEIAKAVARRRRQAAAA